MIDFDTRADILNMEIPAEWEPRFQEMHRRGQEDARQSIISEFGERYHEAKIENFREIGGIPLSVVKYHNVFFHQIRNAFVVGAYYPSLVATCALGERILNHLVLNLRDSYPKTPASEQIQSDKQIINWNSAIDALESWGVLRPDVRSLYRKLRKIRHKVVHFSPSVDQNARATCLEAVSLLKQIVEKQFGAFGPHPWFIPDTPGASFIKQAYESDPYVNLVYLPSCALVGPYHELRWNGQWFDIFDDHTYEDTTISDDEFCELFVGSGTEQIDGAS